MPQQQWARLKSDLDYRIRRGAWYRILKIGSLEAVLDVQGRPTPIPRPFLEIEWRPPMRWSVVQRPRQAMRLPASWGPVYAVCPNCRNRAPLEGHPARIRCGRCNGHFEVAWENGQS